MRRFFLLLPGLYIMCIYCPHSLNVEENRGSSHWVSHPVVTVHACDVCMLVVCVCLLCADERDISPGHKFYTSLPDTEVEQEEKVNHSMKTHVTIPQTANLVPSLHSLFLCPVDQELALQNSSRPPQEDDSDFSPSLLRVSDEAGSLEVTLVSEGRLGRGSLDPKDGEQISLKT